MPHNNIKVLSIQEIQEPILNLTATIGQFDGMHIAHMALLETCQKISNVDKTQKCFITFYPHINSLLNKNSHTPPLLSLEDTIKIVESKGFDYFIIINFDEKIRNLNPQDFCSFLKAKLDIKNLIVGFDFTYGKMASGNVNHLKEFFNTTIVKEIQYHHKKIGTKLIKQYLSQGKIKKANILLGYKFYLDLDDNNKSFNLTLLKNKRYNVLIDNTKYHLLIKKGNIFIKNHMDLRGKRIYFLN